MILKANLQRVTLGSVALAETGNNSVPNSEWNTVAQTVGCGVGGLQLLMQTSTIECSYDQLMMKLNSSA